jgi:hypothetical protein
MAATKDRTHKISFVYSNLYQIYKIGKEATQQSKTGLEGGVILKRLSLSRSNSLTALTPSGQRLRDEGVLQLKQSMQTLSDLNERLQFMLKEIEKLG